MDENETWDRRVMSFDEFWAYVDMCKQDQEAFKQKAEKFSEQEFIDLCWMYKCFAVELADPEYFENYPETDHLSEDTMEDFSWWCVDQGKEFYEKVLADPSQMPGELPDNKMSVYSLALNIYLDRYHDYPFEPDEMQRPSQFQFYITKQLIKTGKGAKNKRNLEYYLLALLKQAEALKDTQPSFQDIARILRDSYKGEQAHYSNDWVKLPVYRNEPNTDEYFTEIESYEYFDRTLKRYIADIHYIRTSIKHAFASSFRSEASGIKGRGDIIWQRTDVNAFLAAGVSSLEGEGKDSEITPGWSLFADILIDGATKE